MKFEGQLVHDIDTSMIQSEAKEINLKFLMDALIKGSNLNKCCLDNFEFIVSGTKCVILSLSHPVPVSFAPIENLYGLKVCITSYVNQKTQRKHQ